MNTFIRILTETWTLIAEVAPWLLVGFALAGLISVVLKRSFVERWLGRPGIGSIFKATLVGVPMPLCSCGVIPVAAAIRERGASRGATAAFLASTPQTGVDSIAATWGMLGPLLAWVRVAVAFISGAISGLLVQVFGREVEGGDKQSHEAHAEGHACCHGEDATHECCHDESHSGHGHASHAAHHGDHGEDAGMVATLVETEEDEAHACCQHGGGGHACCHGGGDDHSHHHHHHDHGEGHSCHVEPAVPRGGLLPTLGRAMKYGFITLPEDMVLSLTVGLVLAGVVGALVPAGFFTSLGLHGVLAYVAVTLFAVPLYVCSTGSIPFAYVLLQAGLSPGSVLVFLVTGPASNAATITTMRRYLGTRGLLAYLAGIVGTAWAVGALLDAGLGRTAILKELHVHEMHPSLFQQGAGIVLVALLLWALAARIRQWVR